MVVSVNYLRLRSGRFVPVFLVASFRAALQASRAEGYRGGRLLAAPHATFWTLTAWDSLDRMNAYRDSGPHATIVPRTPVWGAAAAVAHWDLADGPVPGWGEAAARLQGDGVWLRLAGMRRDRVQAPPDAAGPWTGFLTLAVPRLRRRTASPAASAGRRP